MIHIVLFRTRLLFVFLHVILNAVNLLENEDYEHKDCYKNSFHISIN